MGRFDWLGPDANIVAARRQAQGCAPEVSGQDLRGHRCAECATRLLSYRCRGVGGALRYLPLSGAVLTIHLRPGGGAAALPERLECKLPQLYRVSFEF